MRLLVAAVGSVAVFRVSGRGVGGLDCGVGGGEGGEDGVYGAGGGGWEGVCGVVGVRV